MSCSKCDLPTACISILWGVCPRCKCLALSPHLRSGIGEEAQDSACSQCSQEVLMQTLRTSAFGGWCWTMTRVGVLLFHQPPETGPILAAPHALPTCPFVTNLCSCLVLNFPARCLVINGVSFGSTPAGDRGTPSSAPPVPTSPHPPSFGGWRGGQDGPRTRCMCLPPAVCLGVLMSPCLPGDASARSGAWAQCAGRDTCRSLGDERWLCR